MPEKVLYTVLEIQDDHEQVGVLSYTYDDYDDAIKKFYEIMFYASAGTVPVHSAMIISGGYAMKQDCIRHDLEPGPEEE